MPVTVEGKLELFKKVLFEHIEEDWSEKRSKLIKSLELRLEEKKSEFEKKKKAIIEDSESRVQAKRRMIISRAQSESDYEIMKKKEELLVELTKYLKDWSREFIKGDRYKAFLLKSIEQSFQVMKGQNLLMRFTDNDINELEPFIREQADSYGNRRNIEYATSREDIIGGFTIEDKDSGILADFSIKTLIDEGREFMGKLLYDKLDEVLKA